MTDWQIEGIEVGTPDEPRSPVDVGQDTYLAVLAVRDESLVTTLSIDGRQVAAIVPLDDHGCPVAIGALEVALADLDKTLALQGHDAATQLSALIKLAGVVCQVTAAGCAGNIPAGPRYIAHFTPEVWQNNQAVAVDPLGPDEWDCTAYASDPETLSNGTTRLDYLDWHHRCAQTGGQPDLDSPEGVLDNDDVFRDDPAAPEWVKRHQGPFTLRVRRVLVDAARGRRTWKAAQTGEACWTVAEFRDGILVRKVVTDESELRAHAVAEALNEAAS